MIFSFLYSMFDILTFSKILYNYLHNFILNVKFDNSHKIYYNYIKTLCLNLKKEGNNSEINIISKKLSLHS